MRMGYCCCKKKRWTKTATLSFLRSELLHDIANYAYVEADVMKTDDDHQRHQVFDVTQEGNVERVTRVLDLTFAEINELCYPFTKMNIDDGASDSDFYNEAYAYNIEMRLPDGFSETTFKLLKEYVHEMLVSRVLADWFSITYPEKSAVWLAKAEDMRDRMKSVLFARTGRTRRPTSPF